MKLGGKCSVKLHQQIKKQTDFPEVAFNPFLSKSAEVIQNGLKPSLN